MIISCLANNPYAEFPLSVQTALQACAAELEHEMEQALQSGGRPIRSNAPPISISTATKAAQLGAGIVIKHKIVCAQGEQIKCHLLKEKTQLADKVSVFRDSNLNMQKRFVVQFPSNVFRGQGNNKTVRVGLCFLGKNRANSNVEWQCQPIAIARFGTSIHTFQQELRACDRFQELEAKVDYIGRTLYCSARTSSHKYLLLMEWFNYGDCSHYLTQRAKRQNGAWKPEEFLCFLLKTAQLVKESHAQGVCHGDLKWENVMCHHSAQSAAGDEVNQLILKLGDITTMSSADEPRRQKVGGTPLYWSPEYITQIHNNYSSTPEEGYFEEFTRLHASVYPERHRRGIPPQELQKEALENWARTQPCLLTESDEIWSLGLMFLHAFEMSPIRQADGVTVTTPQVHSRPSVQCLFPNGKIPIPLTSRIIKEVNLRTQRITDPHHPLLLIRSMLSASATDRPTAEEVCNTLEEWIKAFRPFGNAESRQSLFSFSNERLSTDTEAARTLLILGQNNRSDRTPPFAPQQAPIDPTAQAPCPPFELLPIDDQADEDQSSPRAYPEPTPSSTAARNPLVPPSFTQEQTTSSTAARHPLPPSVTQQKQAPVHQGSVCGCFGF